MDQEKRIAYLVKNDWSTAPVPTEYRRSNYGVVATLVGQIIALSGIYIGAGMVGGLTLTQAFIATVIGSIILAVLGGFLSWVGTKTGVGLSMLLRESFGTIGSYIVSLMLLLVAVGFFGYQATFFGATIHAMFPAGGWITSQTVAGVWGGILMMTTALIGYKGIEWLSNWASPLILVMCVLSCILAIVKIGSLEAFNGITIGYTGMTIPTAVVAVVGGYAFGACLQPDFSRMGKSRKASTWGSVGGFLIANVFMTMAGYITCTACGTGDVPTALLQILGYWALLILVFAQWTSNDGNLYFGTLALTTILPRANKHILTGIFGVVGIVLSSLGITNYFLERYYGKARALLAQNEAFLKEITEALVMKKTLLYSDIQAIRGTAVKRNPAVTCEAASRYDAAEIENSPPEDPEEAIRQKIMRKLEEAERRRCS